MSPKDRFQYEVATGRGTLPVVTFITLILWSISSIHEWINVGSLLSFGLVAYLIVETDTHFALIRTRTTLPSSLFLLFYAAIPFMHSWNTSCLLPVLFIALLFSLFQSYESPDASATSFHSFLWLSLGSMIYSPIVWIAPLIFLHMITLRSLSARTFSAGIIGLVLPYALLASYYIYQEQSSEILPILRNLIYFTPIDYTVLNLSQSISWGVTSLLFIIYSILYLQSAYKDKVQSRILLHTIIWMGGWIQVLMLIQPNNVGQLLPLSLIPTSFIGGHLFALTFNRTTRILFFSTLIIWGLFCLFNLWMHFFNF